MLPLLRSHDCNNEEERWWYAEGKERKSNGGRKAIQKRNDNG